MRIKPDPLGVPRDPLAVFLLALALFSGLGFVFGKPTSNSLEASLPHWATVLWGLMLTIGSLASLVGMYWPGDIRDGLLIKRIGMAALASSAVVYAISIWITFGATALLPGTLAFFFGYACYLRYRRINQAINVLIVHKTMNGDE